MCANSIRGYENYPLFSDKEKEIILFRRKFQNTEQDILIRPLHLPRDISVIHEWVNLPYARKYWQMQGSAAALYHYYEDMVRSGRGRSLMVFLGDRSVAQVDYYNTLYDEVSRLYDYRENDHGIHLLMGPCHTPLPGLSREVMKTALAFMQSIGIERIIGEPDVRNAKANKLVVDIGFRFQKQIQMSYKTANLYFYHS